MNEFLEQFLVEGRELIEQGVRDLLELEQNPNNVARLDGAFRAFHTLKGAAGIVDFEAMNRALHAVEDVFVAIRAGKRSVTAEFVSKSLASLDQVTAWLKIIEQTGDLPANATPEAERIIAAFAASTADTLSSPAAHDAALNRVHELLAAQLLLIHVEGEGLEGRLKSATRVSANVLRAGGFLAQANLLLEAGQRSLSRETLESALRHALDALAGAESADAAEAGPAREEGAARALRVDVARIDALVKLTGELTAAKNAIGHVAQMAKHGADARSLAALLNEHHASLERLVGELQHAVLNVRVLPIRQVFQRFPRLVREMSAELRKPARLITEGETTEADKAIVEALFEPLLHVIRNAIDHGVEPSDIRAARGKPAVASIVLRASRSGQHVVVEIEDDGGGVDLARVRVLAAERGLISPEAARALSDAEAHDLIFMPGFSTAQIVTSISGRGVGMDAVRTAIENVGGQVAIESWPERGTLVRFLLPFTLMMTRVMLVHAAGQSFGIPFDAVLETLRVPRTQVSAIGAARAFAYRNQTVPIIDLPASLGAAPGQRTADEAVLVVIHIGGDLAAFEVDRVASSIDIMLSPLDGLLSGVAGVAGATLLGDGSVLIVLDLHQLVL